MEKKDLIKIARYLTTQREGKKHGSYDIYEDEKIRIAYDTYYPNVQVDVFIDGKRELAAIYSGHGHTQEFHHGAWVGYVEHTLLPLAVTAKDKYDGKLDRESKDRESAKSKPLNDSSVFT